MSEERIYLDPTEIDSTRLEVNLHDGGFNYAIADPGPDWGDADIEQYLTELRYGQVPIDYRIPNRIVTLPLVILGSRTTGVTFDEARRIIQQKAALLQRSGGALKRVMGDGRKMYLGVIKATLRMGGGNLPSQFGVDADAVLTLETLPDWYGDSQVFGTQIAYTNELLNPSFEIGALTGWENSRAASFTLAVTRVGTSAYEGVTAATFGVSSVRGLWDFRATAATMVTAVAGESVAFSGYTNVAAPGPSNGWYAMVEFFRADRTTSVGTITGTVTRVTGSYQRVSVVGVTPVNAAFARCIIRFDENAFATWTVIIDALQYMRSTAVLPDYFSGDTPGAKWDGVWSGSTSSTAGTRALVSVIGDYPARLRALITSRNADDRAGMLYAIRPAESALTAAMDYSAVGMTPLGGATQTNAGTVALIQRTGLYPNWVTILSTRLFGHTGNSRHLTHLGPHRVWAAITRNGGAGAMRVRMDYVIGSQLAYTTGREQTLSDGYSWVDLGMVNIDPINIGNNQWEGRILVNSPSGTIQIVRVLVLPVAHGYGEINANQIPGSPADLAMFDTFDTDTAGSLATRVASLGGTWAITTGAAVTADPIQATTALGYCFRSNVPDSATSGITYNQLDEAELAYIVGLSASYVDITMNATTTPIPLSVPRSPNQVAHGILARYVDNRNWLAAIAINSSVLISSWTDYRSNFAIIKRVAGVLTVLYSTPFNASAFSGYHTHRLVVYANGVVIYYVDGVGKIQIVDSALATGGVLDDGSVGLYDFAFASDRTAAPASRIYYNISASTSTTIQDAVLYAGRTSELSWQGFARDNGSGIYAPMVIDGDNPRLPVSGAENRLIEVYVNPMRAALGQTLPDSVQGTNVLSVEGNPCYLFTPEPV